MNQLVDPILEVFVEVREFSVVNAEIRQFLLIIIRYLGNISVYQQCQLDLKNLLLLLKSLLSPLQPSLQHNILALIKPQLLAITNLNPLILFIRVLNFLSLTINQQSQPINLPLQLLNIHFIQIRQVLYL